MVLKETLRLIVREQQEKSDLGMPRTAAKNISLHPSFATVITGIRRAGKSTLLRQLMAKERHPAYFTFEDPRTIAFQVEDFLKLEEVFQEEGLTGPLFFDEIQNVPQWERYIRRILDKKITCCLTGSNASLLSRELGTKLTGRHLSYELFPFSYPEYLTFTKQKAGLPSFHSYVQQGGFPEFLRLPKKQVLQELFQDILLKDIVVRYQLRDQQQLQALMIDLLSNVAKQFSYNKLAQAYHLAVNTVISYIAYFQDSYLLFTLPLFSSSPRKQAVNPKKAYAIDPGFILANSVSFSDDEGRILENMSFLHLRRTNKNLFYFKGKGECDFLVREGNKIIAAVQVCSRVTEENKERELGGLSEALATFGLSQGIIITEDQEDRIGNVRLVPAWKWMKG